MHPAAMLLPVAIAAYVFRLAATTSADVFAVPSRTASIGGSTARNKFVTSVASPMTSLDVVDVPTLAGGGQPEADCDERNSVFASAFVHVVSQSTKYILNVEDRIGQLREMHVHHRLQVRDK